MKSSDLIFSQRSNGSVAIGFEDNNVEVLGGANTEVMYYLDAANFFKLLKSLEIPLNVDIKKELIAVFGNRFNTTKFVEHCDERNIIYKKKFGLAISNISNTKKRPFSSKTRWSFHLIIFNLKPLYSILSFYLRLFMPISFYL